MSTTTDATAEVPSGPQHARRPDPTVAAERRFRLGLVGAAITAFAIRMWTLATVAKRNPDGFGDPAYYHLQANMLVKGIGFSEPFRYYFLHQRPAIPSASHPPLYSLWLAIPSALGLQSWTDHKVWSCVAGTLAVVVIGLVAREIGGRRAGVIAAFLAACYPNLWMIDGILIPEGLFALLIAGTLWASYRWWRRPRMRTAALVGALVGLAALARGEAVILIVVLCVPLVLRERSIAWGDRFKQLAVLGVVAVAVLTPWAVRNSLRFHHAVPLSNNGNEVIYYANCQDSYYGTFTGFWSFNCQQRDRAAHGEPPGDESDKAIYWRDKGIQYAKDHSGRLPTVLAVRLGRIWDVYAPFQNAHFTITEGRTEWVSQAGLLYYWACLPLAAVGLWALHRRRITLWPLLAMAVEVTLTALYAYGALRFRIPADVAILIAAAVGVDALLRRGRTDDPDLPVGPEPEAVVLAGPDGAAGEP